MGEYIQHVQVANGVIRDTRAIRFSRCPRNHLTDPNLTIAGSRFWSVKSNKILAMNELERWANFYLLVAASAATLIGLLFVVITLASERKLAEASKIPIYLTPTVIYFATVILLPALLTFPTQSRLTANFCICLMGVVGLRLVSATRGLSAPMPPPPILTHISVSSASARFLSTGQLECYSRRVKRSRAPRIGV
jgi:hypothetical protein